MGVFPLLSPTQHGHCHRRSSFQCSGVGQVRPPKVFETGGLSPPKEIQPILGLVPPPMATSHIDSPNECKCKSKQLHLVPSRFILIIFHKLLTMENINFLSIATAFRSLLEQTYEFDIKSPTDEEEQIAKKLLEKFHEVLHEFVFVEDEQHLESSYGMWYKLVLVF
jgi:hypothetical protein